MAEKENIKVDPDLTKTLVKALNAASERLRKEHKTDDALVLKHRAEQVAEGKAEVNPSKSGERAAPEASVDCWRQTERDGEHFYCIAITDDGDVIVRKDGQIIMSTI